MPQQALIWLLLAGPVLAARQDVTCEPASPSQVDHQESRDSTIRVVFLGNSHTYVNQMPCLVQRLAASLEHGVNLEVVVVARDGATLEQHWGDRPTRALLQARAWDFLILQEQGNRPIANPERTSVAVQRFSDAARRVGARMVLYIPPAGRDRPSDLHRVAPVYRRIAAATGSAIAPAAQAWHAVQRADSTLDLHDADGVHANPIGSYLTACVLLAAITQGSPAGVAPLALRRPYGSAPGTAAILDTLGRSQAATLQAAAWKAARESR
jgi:hypothetical protein